MTVDDLVDEYRELLSWDHWTDDVGEIEDLRETERNDFRSAVAFLRKELGEGFLGRALRESHPIIGYLTNYVAWTRRRITQLGKVLGRWADRPAYPELLERVADARRFAEAWEVLQVADWFGDVGFVCDFDEEIAINGRDKRPDICLTCPHSQERVIVEVTDLLASDDAIASSETMDRVHQAIHTAARAWEVCGRIHRILEEPDIERLISKVRSGLESAERAREEFFAIDDPDASFAFARSAANPHFVHWAALHSIEPNAVAGPHYDFNDLDRTLGKINRKRHQLPRTHAGVLVIRAVNLVWFGDRAEVIGHVERWIERLEQIHTVVLWGGVLNAPEKGFERLGRHAVVRLPFFDGGGTETRVIVRNPACRIDLSEETSRMLGRGLTQGLSDA